MKKAFLLVFILLLSFSLFGCVNGGIQSPLDKEGQPKEKPQQTDNDKAAVASLVEKFGSRLKKVSLQAPKDIVKKSMQENYGDVVSPSLLAEWVNNTQNALGRVVSSPWPERIEIQRIEKMSDSAYDVKGQIIEITSVEMANGGAAAKRPISLGVAKVENRWMITSVKLGAYQETDATVYRNIQYGFSFSLPKTWKGYSIVTTQWEGLAIGSSQIVETGPLISIRHPQWTTDNPRQDIPIMVFTLTQWNSLQQEKFHIGAAPSGPSELGRNASYVFALPARYNFAFLAGFEEVEDILKNNPLQANDS
ncbi:MAG: hypothetical protein M0T74_08350 [Desulfitobacterium hafniense]|nr:hypothetical protein [Desulfitobacterium hafniense]